MLICGSICHAQVRERNQRVQPAQQPARQQAAQPIRQAAQQPPRTSNVPPINLNHAPRPQHSSSSTRGNVGSVTFPQQIGGQNTNSTNDRPTRPTQATAPPRNNTIPGTPRPIRNEYHPPAPPAQYHSAYNPILNYPGSDALYMGFTFFNSPSYGSYPATEYSSEDSYIHLNNSNSNSNATVNEKMDGYVIFARDTIKGAITLNATAVLLETTDSGTNLDYKFRKSHDQLVFVSVVNDENKQLHLTKLKDEPKKLYRLVHEGKLTIYDNQHDFIYAPDDIDIRHLTVVYDRKVIRLSGSNANEIKQRRTTVVNTVYNLQLKSNDFTWNELLIYIDKLD